MKIISARLGPVLLTILAGALGCGGDGTNSTTSTGMGTGGDGGSGGQACIPSTEACDGKDNDCDGKVDEDLGENECGIGACTRLAANCVNGSPGACVPGMPSDEICDGIDNDCDGSADEDLPDLTCGVGACAAVAPACVNGSPGSCTPGTPADEVCDGKDNDCNGQTDEGLGMLSCGVGACAVTVAACDKGVVGMCVPGLPTAEVCNGVDDDCNATIDDGDPGAGQICDTGMPGICAAGTTACTGGSIACNPNAMPGAETCNGIDDDCNGMIDDGTPEAGQTCMTGLSGACATGMQACVNGAVQCMPNVMPVAELCGNATDDDCDGTIDEAFETAMWETRVTNTSTPTIVLDVVWNGSVYAVLYYESMPPNSNAVVYLQRVSAAGALIGAPAAISTTTGYTSAARIAWNGTEYGAVLWTYEMWPDDATKFQRVSATGALIGAPIDIDPNPSAQPNIVWNGTDYAITWMSRVTSQIMFQRRSATGALLGSSAVLGAGHSVSEMAWTGTQYGVTWDLYDFNASNNTGYFTRVGSNGSEIGNEIVTTPMPTPPVGCCGIDGLFDISWNGSNFAILRRGLNNRPTFIPVSAMGVLGASSIVSDEQGLYPAIVWNGTEYLAAYHWFNVGLSLARLDAMGKLRGKTVLTHSSIGNAKLVWDGSNFAVAWHDNRFSNYEVSIARFANGCQ